MKNFNSLTTAQCVSMSIAIMLLLFAIDLIIPLGVAFGVLYALPVLITFTTKRKKITILFAVLATILVLIGYYNSPHGGEEWKVIFNRSISIFVIWSVALSVLHYYKLVENATELNGRLTKNNLQLNNLKSILYETNTLAKVGSWELNIEKTNFFWSDTIKEILEEPISYKPDWNTAIKYFEKGEPAKTIYDITKKAIIEGTGFDVSTQVFTAKGKQIWIRVIGKTELKGGKCVRLYGSLQDITDRKNSEKKLKLSLEENNNIKTALNRSAILAYTDEKGVITYVNDKFLEISQYSNEELIGANHRIINSGHHSKEWMKDMWTTIKLGKIWQGDFKNKAKDGSFYWVKSTIVPSFDENGKITQYITIRYDITDRKKAEAAVEKQQEELVNKNNKLERKEANLSALIQNTSDVFWTLDRENKLILCNKAFIDLHFRVNNKAPEIGEPLCVGMLLKESVKKCVEIHKRSLNGLSTTLTRPVHFNDSEDTLYYEFRVNPLKDDDGKVIGSVVSGRDINEIYEAKLEAEAATAVKSKFVSTISHELRTPLNAILGMSNHLVKFNKQENLTEDIEILKQASDNLFALITDILDFSKLESNKAVITTNEFDFRTYIDEVVKFHSPSLVEKNLVLNIEVSKDIPQYVLFDKSKLNQIISNLLSNAIKFTELGSVTLKVIQLNHNQGISRIQISVEDTGIGIPEAELARVFESFAQSSLNSQGLIGGTGLGLAITKKLVNLLNGKINIESTTGKGSIFTVELDFEVSLKKKEPIKKVNGKEIDLIGINVLVAEDNLINAKIITRLLGQWNATVDLAENGEIAVGLAKENAYNLILMDIQMPVKNGFEATDEIRLFGLNQKTPILALTAQPDFLFDDNYREGMFDAHVIKPFRPESLKSCILKHSRENMLESIS